MSKKIETPDDLLAIGLKNTWYAICPSNFITNKPVSLRRLGKKLVFWRDEAGKLYALEDHCPHRGAPLSKGILLGDRIQCGYHGVQVRNDGTVTSVPGSPGCSLEGKRATLAFHVVERNDVVFLYNATENIDVAPDFTLPSELVSDEYGSFLCYTEWKGDYRYVIDNVMDPMHGTYLHKQSHSMSEGSTVAEFGVRDTDTGFIFEKKGQRGVNFDWTEWANTGLHWLRLEIPYPSSGGPGGNFAIIGTYTPISENLAAVFHWRCRKVSGWQRDAWKFLYRSRLEARHWAVLEQDREVLEVMEPDANEREILYQHDLGLVRVRRQLRNLAAAQFDELKLGGALMSTALRARRVIAPSVPERAGASWSNCLVLGNEIAISGVTAAPQASAEQPLGAYDQTMVILGKIRALVEAAGGGVQNVYKLVVYVTDIRDKDEVGRARTEFFKEFASGMGVEQAVYPCSTLVAVNALVFPALKVEIDAFSRLDASLY